MTKDKTSNRNKTQSKKIDPRKIVIIKQIKKPNLLNNVFFYVLVFFAIYLIFNAFQQNTLTEKKPISEVINLIKEEKVQDITISGDIVEALLKDGSSITSEKESNISFDEVLKNNDVDRSRVVGEIKVEHRVAFMDILSPILMFAFPLLILFIIFKQMKGASGDIMSFGKTRARIFDKKESSIAFKDVAGNEEAKTEMMEIVDFLKHPQKYQNLGARIPRGILLVGPSGVGKTLLAKAIAGEAGVPFFSAAGSEFMEMLVGVGSSRVRDLFKMAKDTQPSLIFIDEIDAIGRQRGMGIGGGHDEREQTLNQILIEMDGFDSRTNVIVVAASVTGDTPILIKRNHNVKLMPIGEFIDSCYTEDTGNFEVGVEDVQTLSFIRGEKGEINARFTNVRGVFRHKVKEIYEIEYLGGKIKATGNHSVFVKEGKEIFAKPVSLLKKGDELVDITPRKIMELGNKYLNSNISKYIQIYLEDEKTKYAYVYAMQNKGSMSQSDIAHETGFAQTTISLWHREINGPRNLSKKYYKYPLPEEVKITPDLLRLLGYYTAEGYARKEIDFCFNEKEKEYIEDVKNLMKTTFNLTECIERHTTHNAVNLVYSSSSLADVFKLYCGSGAKNKHIPSFLFELPYEYFLEYLKGLFRGDGHQDNKGRLEITSVSEQLIDELIWLSRIHGLKGYKDSFVAKEGRVIKEGGKPLKEVRAFRFGMGKYYNPFNNLNKEDIVYSIKRPVVKSIKKVSFNNYVYDLCGCDNEAFFGGDNPVLLHNTNRPDMLDPALIRPGRFDRRITLILPDLKDREEIIKIHMRGKPFDSNFSVEKAAKKTVGFSGADIENMLNEAAILAARNGKTVIDQSDVEEASIKVTLGSQRKTLMSDEEKKMTAYHEAGHALVASKLSDMDPVSRVTIVARGGSLGHTAFPPERDRYNETKSRLLSFISTSLGGRAAEEIVFNELTIGAANDIDKATSLAREMVMEYGMSTLGPVSYDGKESRIWFAKEFGSGPKYSESMAAKIDDEVKSIIDKAYIKAKEILKSNRETLDRISGELLKKETLDGDEFYNIVNGKSTK